MNLYVVYADTYTDQPWSWGAEIEIFGIFSTKEKANQCITANKKYFLQVREMTLDIPYRVYLGGYVE